MIKTIKNTFNQILQSDNIAQLQTESDLYDLFDELTKDCKSSTEVKQRLNTALDFSLAIKKQDGGFNCCSTKLSDSIIRYCNRKKQLEFS